MITEMGIPKELIEKFGIETKKEYKVKRTVEDTYIFKVQDNPVK